MSVAVGLRWPALVQDAFHRAERFLTDVMFDSFAVSRSGTGGNAQFSQKRFHDFVPPPRLCRQPPAGFGQLDRLIGSCFDQSVALQSFDRVVNRRMSDAELFNQFDGPANAALGDRIGNRFDVVLGYFAGVVGAGSLVNFCRQCPVFP